MPGFRQHAPRSPQARHSPARGMNQRGPRVRAAAAGTERVLLPGRARHHAPSTPASAVSALTPPSSAGGLLAHYVMTVKQNTPGLFTDLDALDWASVPVQHVTEEAGHGRRERRTIQVMDAPARIRARLPHARQAALIERYVTRTGSGRKRPPLG